MVDYQDYILAVDSGGLVIAKSADEATQKKPLDIGRDSLRSLKTLLGLLYQNKLDERAQFADLGNILYSALLGPPIQGHFDQAFRAAKEQNRGLRIQLDLDEHHRLPDDGMRSAALPWEFLHDDRDPDYFLAIHNSLTLSRFVAVNSPVSRLPLQGPLKILFAASQPEGLNPVFTESAREVITRELLNKLPSNQVDIAVLEQPNKRKLVRKVAAYQPHVLHFMGHARFREAGCQLALVDASSNAPYWLGHDEMQILFEEWQPYVVVLIACQGGAESLAWPFVSLARQTVRHNIQVVSMQFEVTNQAAMTFTRELYAGLAAGRPVDAAVQQARRCFFLDDRPVTRDFGAAVLHMRSPIGIIAPPPPDGGSIEKAAQIVTTANELVTQMGMGGIEQTARTAAQGEVAKYQAKFLYSIVSSKEFADIGFVFNPYSEFLDPTDPKVFDLVTVYLWLPEPSYFGNKIIEDTCIVAVCDAGMLEIDKKSDRVDFSFLSTECYPYSPQRLYDAKKAKLVPLIGNVMRGTFILGAVVPRLLLGAGLKKPDTSYQSILNTVLLPLVVAHSNFGFSEFRLVFSDVIDHTETVAVSAKRIIKAGYSEKKFEIAQARKDTAEYFYIYAAQFISAAVRSHYSKEKDDYWLIKLNEAFKQ